MGHGLSVKEEAAAVGTIGASAGRGRNRRLGGIDSADADGEGVGTGSEVRQGVLGMVFPWTTYESSESMNASIP